MPQNNSIRSEEVQDILAKTPSWMLTWGNVIILGLLLLFLVFTWFIKYPDIITSEALITSQYPTQKEYASVSGKIDTLLIKDKDSVRPDEILAMIENTAKLKDVLFLKAIMDTVSLNKTSFSFPLEQLPALALGEMASAYTLFESDYLEYSLNRKLNPYANQILADRFSEKELQLRLLNLENQKEINQRKFELSQNEFNRNKQLFEKGVISLNEFENKKLQFLEQERNLKNLDISLSQVKQLLNQAHKNTKDTQVDHEIENVRLFKNVVQSYTKLQDAIKAWELKYLLKSNVEGTVSLINVWSKDQYVKSGELVFTIIPKYNKGYMAKIKAPIQNSGKIRTGQKVNIKLFNFPETEYGMLPAKITSMSAVPDEEGYYLVNASLDSNLITSYNIEIPFKNEMKGNAEIITQDLRLLERFFYQFKGIFN